jgi:hypothetical protein
MALINLSLGGVKGKGNNPESVSIPPPFSPGEFPESLAFAIRQRNFPTWHL